MSLQGTLWWTASDQTEVERWQNELGPKGVEFKTTRQIEGLVDVFLTLDRDKATEILGYTPDEEEWMVEA